MAAIEKRELGLVTKGCTVPLDLETALYWYHASEQEVDEAYILGLCYLHGRDIFIEKAEQYFKEAMLYGNPDAKRHH